MPSLTRTNLSAAKANRKEDKVSPTRADSQSATLSDNRPGTLAQMKLLEAMSEGPQAQKTAQLQAVMHGNTPIQKTAEEEEVQMKATPLQKKENNTGLPDNLKSGVENLSGVSMNDVKVHPNSDQPAQMQAHAFAQGTNIHVGPGQEKHLPHEAWHVVQQKQGRVKPTNQLKGEILVNDDKRLEHEADVMGAKASNLSAFNESATQLKSININSTAIRQFTTDEAKAELEDLESKKIVTENRQKFEKNSEVNNNEAAATGGEREDQSNAALTNKDAKEEKAKDEEDETGNNQSKNTLVNMATLGIGVAGDGAAVGAGTFDKISKGKELFDATSDATGTGVKGTFKEAGDTGFGAGDVGAAAGQVLGVVGSGYKAFMAGWENQEKGNDLISKADLGIKGAGLISKATEMSMHFAKSDTVTGLFPGVNSSINLLQAGLDMMKDKRAADAISTIETGGSINADASIYLEQYASNIQWKMIEDGAEAIWAAAELIGLAFPGANVGIGLLHSATNLLKGGVKMYQTYSSGKKAKAAERLDIGKKGGLSKDELQQVQSTKEMLKNAGDPSHPWFLGIIKMEQQKTNLEAMDERSPEQVLEMNDLQKQINHELDVYKHATGSNLSEKDILNATTLFLNLIRSLKADIIKDHSRFKRLENWFSRGYFGQKVSAKTFFTEIFGDNADNKKTDLEILTALEENPESVGEYLGPKLSRTVQSAEGYSAADLSNDQLVEKLKPQLVKSAENDEKVFATFANLAPDIFSKDAMYNSTPSLDQVLFSKGLDKYFNKINPF